EGSIGNGLDLTGILFGNIDSEGRLLQDDDGEGRGGTGFDAELRENIGSLSKLGLDSMLLEVIDLKEA
nr:Chain A, TRANSCRIPTION INITIATION FACTOR IID 230K CHAIN [Drosophila melanogaster]